VCASCKRPLLGCERRAPHADDKGSVVYTRECTGFRDDGTDPRNMSVMPFVGHDGVAYCWWYDAPAVTRDPIAWMSALLDEVTRLVPPGPSQSHSIGKVNRRLGIVLMLSRERWQFLNFDEGDGQKSPRELAEGVAALIRATTAAIGSGGESPPDGGTPAGEP